MAAAASPSFEHPSLKEGFSDKLYRNVNEMVIADRVYSKQDFKGQELAEKIISRGMIGCSVSKITYVSNLFRSQHLQQDFKHNNFAIQSI